MVITPETVELTVSDDNYLDLRLKYMYIMQRKKISKPEFSFDRRSIIKECPVVLVRKLEDKFGELRKNAAEINSIELPKQSVAKTEDERIEN
jgi:hypothetical protein